MREEAERVHAELCRIESGGSRPLILYAKNLATGAYYQHKNGCTIQRAHRAAKLTCPNADVLLVATFKQAQALGLRVHAGEKALARVTSYRDDETAEDRRTVTRRGYTVQTPVFHVSQLIPATDVAAQELAAKLDKTREEHFETYAPAWLTKFMELYQARQALDPSHDLAMAASAVPPLVVLAARKLLIHAHEIPPEKLEANVTHDIRPYLWPAFGLPRGDAFLADMQAKYSDIDWTPLDRLHPRTSFARAEEYYSTHAYLMSAAVLLERRPAGNAPTRFDDKVLCIVSAERALTRAGVPFVDIPLPYVKNALCKLCHKSNKQRALKDAVAKRLLGE